MKKIEYFCDVCGEKITDSFWRNPIMGYTFKLWLSGDTEAHKEILNKYLCSKCYSSTLKKLKELFKQ